MRPNHEMRIGKFAVATLVVAGVIAVVGCSGDQAMTSPTSPGGGGQGASMVQIGHWGGSGITLDVSDSEARLELACAHALLSAPIPLDSIGSFTAPGTYFPEGMGPIPDGDVQGHPATFLGRVTGDVMKLSVTLDEGNEFVGSFELVRNQAGRVIKCQ